MGRKPKTDEVRDLRARLRREGPGAIPRIANSTARTHWRDASLEPVLELVRRLWRGRPFDERSLAIAIIARLARKLGAGHWDEFRKWVDQADEPDHARALGEGVFGPLVCRDYTWCRVLGSWVRSENPHVRLAAAVAVGLRAARLGDVRSAREVCEPLLDDPDPLVRKSARAAIA